MTITPDNVNLVVGDPLVLNCTGETISNGRIKFTWEFPKKKVIYKYTNNHSVEQLSCMFNCTSFVVRKIAHMTHIRNCSRKIMLFIRVTDYLCQTLQWRIRGFTNAKLSLNPQYSKMSTQQSEFMVSILLMLSKS